MATIRYLVVDLDTAMTRIRPAGARFRGEPVQGPGGRQVLIDNPSGNPIEISEERD